MKFTNEHGRKEYSHCAHCKAEMYHLVPILKDGKPTGRFELGNPIPAVFKTNCRQNFTSGNHVLEKPL